MVNWIDLLYTVIPLAFAGFIYYLFKEFIPSYIDKALDYSYKRREVQLETNTQFSENYFQNVQSILMEEHTENLKYIRDDILTRIKLIQDTTLLHASVTEAANSKILVSITEILNELEGIKANNSWSSDMVLLTTKLLGGKDVNDSNSS